MTTTVTIAHFEYSYPSHDRPKKCRKRLQKRMVIKKKIYFTKIYCKNSVDQLLNQNSLKMSSLNLIFSFSGMAGDHFSPGLGSSKAWTRRRSQVDIKNIGGRWSQLCKNKIAVNLVEPWDAWLECMQAACGQGTGNRIPTRHGLDHSCQGMHPFQEVW